MNDAFAITIPEPDHYSLIQKPSNLDKKLEILCGLLRPASPIFFYQRGTYKLL